MSIVLFILQILGIIVLVLLALFLLIVLSVLFSPLAYTVEGEIRESKWVKAKLHWLFHIVRLYVTYEDNLIYGVVRFLWKKYTFSYDLTENKAEDDEKECKTKRKKPKEKRSLIEKLKEFFEKLKIAYPRIKKILTDDRNKKAIHLIKRELLHLIKIFLPKKSSVHATFSTGAPDTTGQLCGILALFPVMYEDGWELRPDFVTEEPYFEGDFSGKKNIYVYQLVGIFLRIMFDKNCRRMYTMINRLIKNIKKTNGQEDK